MRPAVQADRALRRWARCASVRRHMSQWGAPSAQPAPVKTGFMLLRPLLLLAIVPALLLAGPPEVLGHNRGNDPAPWASVATANTDAAAAGEAARDRSTSQPGSSVPMALASAIFGAVAVARSRRLTALALSGALVVLLVEAGVHSVHHLGSQNTTAHCGHAAAAPHLVAPVSVPEASIIAPHPTGDMVTPCVRDSVRTRLHRPDTARSPPGLSSRA